MCVAPTVFIKKLKSRVRFFQQEFLFTLENLAQQQDNVQGEHIMVTK